MKKIFLILSILYSAFVVVEAFAAESFPEGGETRNFTLTGYYSPLPNQPYFLTGSYESEIRLNGRGKFGADGTAVYPGMIAAPKSYKFGSSVCLPNFGCGKIHDRGGAIVEKGGRSIARHDRLDLWMGYGQEGLTRALALGLKHVEGKIYEAGNIPVNVNFTVPSTLESIIDAGNYPEFNYNLSSGSKGESVKKLKESLLKLGFEVDESDEYDENLRQTILKFQLKNYVIVDENENGAGRFGPKTRAKFSDLLYKQQVQQKITELWNSFYFETEMKRGKRSEEVVRLQQILVQKEFLEVAPTGYFGFQTEAALKEFQKNENLIQSKNQTGAGVFGPKTKKRVNKLLSESKKMFDLEQEKVLAYKKVKNNFLVFCLRVAKQTFGKMVTIKKKPKYGEEKSYGKYRKC